MASLSFLAFCLAWRKFGSFGLTRSLAATRTTYYIYAYHSFAMCIYEDKAFWLTCQVKSLFVSTMFLRPVPENCIFIDMEDRNLTKEEIKLLETCPEVFARFVSNIESIPSVQKLRKIGLSPSMSLALVISERT